jgi:phage replication O-like protein O
MANPQTEKGYTRIANEILEHISKTDLNGTQLRILLVIWRYTYGFSRKEYEITLVFLANAINSTKSHANKELTILIDRKIISVVGIGPRRGRILRFNKNYDEWSDRTVLKEDPPETPKKAVEQKPKKRSSKQYDENNTYFKMALYFHEKVSVVAKDAGVEHLIKKANMQKWADDFRKLIEIDEVDKRLAKDVMDWVTKDEFWKTNVLSAKKLREKFGELAIKMNATKKPVKPLRKVIKDTRDKEIEFQRWILDGGDPNEFDWRK